MAKSLERFNQDNFYGFELIKDPIPGLYCEIRHGLIGGRRYSYLVFIREERIKWKIVPMLKTLPRYTSRGQRTKLGRRPNVKNLKIMERVAPRRFRSVAVSTSATIEDLDQLFDYIKDQEKSERME